jgi:hypothetical protein
MISTKTGAPRPMKMGTILSPWHYDAGARHALKSVNLRRPAILPYASWPGVLPTSQDARFPFGTVCTDRSGGAT